MERGARGCLRRDPWRGGISPRSRRRGGGSQSDPKDARKRPIPPLTWIDSLFSCRGQLHGTDCPKRRKAILCQECAAAMSRASIDWDPISWTAARAAWGMRQALGVRGCRSSRRI